jgi:hypothetical protein
VIYSCDATARPIVARALGLDDAFNGTILKQ